MKETILLVEDDPGVAKGLVFGLNEEGFDVHHAQTGTTALSLVRSIDPTLILLDLRLPDMSGFDVCKQIRVEQYSMPIIMVTARDEEMDRVIGLEIGADDYVVKPFSFRELVSRIRAQIRRSYGSYRSNSTTIRISDITIDTTRIYVTRGADEVSLTPIEYKLLVALASSPDRAFSRAQLIRAGWGESIFLEDERTVDVHIRHLREKLEDDPARPAIVETIRGFGYRMRSVKKS